MKNKIGWCNLTFNPVWGCLNNCEYCYARRIAERFAGRKYIAELKYKRKNNIQNVPDDYIFLWDDLKHFKPNFIHSNFNKKFPKKPQRIFVGSMSEIYYWEPEWIERVIEKVKQYPQHTFQFLTRFHVVYNAWLFPENCWLGKTITREKDLGIPFLMVEGQHIKYLSIEPILEKIDPKLFNGLNIDWVIIGAETGNRKNKIIPRMEWIDRIVNYCKGAGIPIYIKDNLSKYYDEYRGYKQFPK